MREIGHAALGIIPTFDGFDRQVRAGTSKAMLTAGASAGRGFSGAFKKAAKVGIAGGIGAVFGVAAFAKDSIELEARYSKTMAQMRVATQAPADELQKLDDLAIKLGKETVFSAVDASDAMLELAKNGIRPAAIQAGALESALTLAAAGSVDLDQAAGTMGNTLNAFRLEGSKSALVASALAGAANASSASVGSLAQGLQQASTVAADTGLNVQETTGILAAFANAGISGSDAGTSLKTMLTRLVPTTKKARDAMRLYGLEFTTANGEFKSAVQIADELQTGLGDLSAKERSVALSTIFGSDARRAATILTKEGADGLAKYIKATSDQGAAEEMAQANMEGTAGAIERLKGSWETAQLQFGKALAPAAADGLDYLADKVDDLAPKLVDFGQWFVDDGVPKIKQFSGFVRDDVIPVLQTVGEYAGTAAGLVGDLVGAFADLPTTDKIAATAGVLAGGITIKHQFGKIFERGGIGNPMYVVVTNPGGIPGTGSPGNPGGTKVPRIVPPVAVAAGPALATWLTMHGLNNSQELAATNPSKARGMQSVGSPYGGVHGQIPLVPSDDEAAAIGKRLREKDGKSSDADRTDALSDFYTSGAVAERTAKRLGIATDDYNKKLDITKTQLKAVRRNADDVTTGLNKAKDAGIKLTREPIRPQVALMGYDAAMRQLALLRAQAASVTGPQGAAIFGGAGDPVANNNRGGGGTATNQRAGVNFNGPIHVVAQNPNEMLQYFQRKSQQAGLGGFG